MNQALPSVQTGTKRTRGRNGCLNCRAKRKKCDESKPICSRCRNSNNTCKWDDAFPFRSIGISATQPSTPETPSNGATLQIVDVSFENGSKRQKTRFHHTNQEETNGTRPTSTTSEDVNNSVEIPDDRSRVPFLAHNGRSSSVPYTPQQTLRQHSPVQSQHPPAVIPSPHSNVGSAPSGNFSERLQIVSDTNHVSKDVNMQQSNHAGLGALDYLTSHMSNIDTLASAVQTGDVSMWSPDNETGLLSAGDSQTAGSPDMYSLYYPNAQYRELHSTLHQHMVKTARDTAMNRQNSPEDLVSDGVSRTVDSSSRSTRKETGLRSETSYVKCDLVTPRRQLELWRNYLDEIAPWLDMFDTNKHFQNTVPGMARSALHLHYSILSLSARQIERRSSEKLYTESLDLYQQAIKLIVHRLQELETEVIASCVLLCVLEMMSSSPRAWARHLDGCAMLLEAAGINGAVGGIRQAVFWCFARMDLWGGYLGDTITKIPTNRWFIPSGSMAVAVSQFKEGSNMDTYANYAVFLCASVVNVISTQEVRQGGSGSGKSGHATDTSLYNTRWKALYDLLEDWYDDRPEELLPLLIEQTAVDDYQYPFPIILHATPPGISGNQMYHAAALLMLQHKPKEVRLPKSRKSILWHARQICGIATSNANHSAWTNALQPLWMAGKVMSHPSEHQAILDILERIEKETGFATEWRANDLKEYWGDGSD